MTLIKGILKNASGVRPNTKIILIAQKTTSSVLNYAPDLTIITDANGAYSFECNPSTYLVVIMQTGNAREQVGTIQVYSDSLDGSLNDFFTMLNPDDVTPEIIKELELLRDHARESADRAEAAADNAANDAADEFSQQFQDRFNTLAPIQWTPNTEIKANQSLQVFEYDGLFYLPNVKKLPFTTGSTFNADNWILSELMTQMKHWRDVGDIRGWGAVGDGVTDDTVAIQNAIDDCITHKRNLLFTSGDYLITAAKTTDTKIVGKGVHINGAIKIRSVSGAVFRCTPSKETHVFMFIIHGASNVTIDGGTWIGDKDTHLGSTGEFGACITVSCSSNINIRNVNLLKSWGDGLAIYNFPAITVPQSGHGYISAPTITVSGGGGSGWKGFAVLGDGHLGDKGTIHRVTTTTVGTGYTSPPTIVATGGGGSGVIFDPILVEGRLVGIAVQDAQVSKNVHVENAIVRDHSRNCLTLGSAIDSTFTNCDFSNANRIAPQAGVDIEPDGQQPAARNIVFTNCTVKDNVVVGMAVGGGNGAKGITVRGCVFQNNGVGISAQRIPDSIISENKFYGGVLTGLGGGGSLIDCDSVTFQGNIVHVNNHTTGFNGLQLAGTKTKNVIISDNIIYGVNRGITVSGTPSDVIISNNKLYDCETFIYAHGKSENLLISGNNFSNSKGTDALFCADIKGYSIIGNKFCNLHGAAIYGNMHSCTISNNDFYQWGLVSSAHAAIIGNIMDDCYIANNRFVSGNISKEAVAEVGNGTLPNYILNNELRYSGLNNPLQRVNERNILDQNNLVRRSSIPTTGKWVRGQKFYAYPITGGVEGWVCVKSGSPGLWKAFGSIE